MVGAMNDSPRESGTVVSWHVYPGYGRIKTDRGDVLTFSVQTTLQGFRELAKGRRVEFARIGVGHGSIAAGVVVCPEDSDADMR